MKAKKIISLITAIILIIQVFPISAFSLGFNNADETVKASNVDYNKLSDYILSEIKRGKSVIDISGFEISTENYMDVQNILLFDIPEALIDINFVVHYDYFNKLTTIDVKHIMPEVSYNVLIQRCEDAAADILEGIINNSSLSEVEKALLVHDRIIANCEYDRDSIYGNVSHSMYGCLVNGFAVCEGYAKTYKYLMNKLGIKCEIKAGQNHAWNLVYIDSKPYYVDTTYDDPLPDSTGKVSHANFLLSANSFGKNHSPVDSSVNYSNYEYAVWTDSTCETLLINNKLYYYAYRESAIKELRTNKTLYVFPVNIGGVMYRFYNTSLATDGKKIFFCLTDGIYSLDPETQKIEQIFTQKDHYTISGIRYKDGTFTIEYLKNNVKTKEKIEYAHESVTFGDVNSDNSINSTDALLVLQYTVGITSLSTKQRKAADVTKDSVVNSVDALKILEFTVGKIKTL